MSCRFDRGQCRTLANVQATRDLAGWLAGWLAICMTWEKAGGGSIQSADSLVS